MSLSQAAVLELLLWPEKAQWWPTTIAWIHSRSLMRPDLSKLQAPTALGRKAWTWTYGVNAFACTSLRIVCFKYWWVLIFSRGKKTLDVCRRKLLFHKILAYALQRRKKKKKPIQNTTNTKLIYLHQDEGKFCWRQISLWLCKTQPELTPYWLVEKKKTGKTKYKVPYNNLKGNSN